MQNTKTKLFLAFFISGFFLFGLTGVSEAADYDWYFSQSSGNDTISDGSIGKPWKTMSKVQSQINLTNSTDTVKINLKRGDTWTFGDANPLLSFGATKGTITLTAYGSGALPILDGEIDFTNLPDPIGGRMFWDKVIWIHKPNCTIEYINIKRMYGGAIVLNSGSDGATIQHCNFHDWGSNCIGGDPGANLANITVQYCSIYRGEQLCRYGELPYSSHGAGIAMIFGNHDPSNLYQHNLIYDISGEGININSGIAQYNIIYNTKSTGILMTTGEGNYDGGDVTARRNLIFGTTSATYGAQVKDGRNFNGSGITVQDESTQGDNTTYNGKIYENIIIGRLWGIWIYNNQADASNKMGYVHTYNNLLIDNYRNIVLGGHEATLGYSDIDVHDNLSIKYDLTGGTGSHASDWIPGGLPNPAISITHNHFWTTGGSPVVNSGFRTNYVVTDPKLSGETKDSPVNWDGLTAPSDLDFDTDFDTSSLPLQVETWGLGPIKIDSTSPVVSSFTPNKTTVDVNDSITFSWEVEDDDGDLKQVELYRKINGDPWVQVPGKIQLVSGTSASGIFTDVPTIAGAYQYGLHVVDQAGNVGTEPNPPGPIAVTVSAPVSCDYYVPVLTAIVDGDTFCGGFACTSDDTICIRGGARGGLLFKDFDGAGSYITITNENKDPNSIVVIDGRSGLGCLSISNCKYIDLRGNNDGDLAYGIKVINDDTSQSAATVWVYGESHNIKLSYLETTCEGNPTVSGDGIKVGDSDLTSAWTFDTFEIHHNYIHDTRYAGMYLGMNNPPIDNNPYVANFAVHDNLLEDLGSYGITLKGVHSSSGTNKIYNNIIRGSSGGQSTGLVEFRPDPWKFGIGAAYYYGGVGCNIYNNRIDKTVGAGIHVGIPNQQVYDNTICGCGTGNDVLYGNGIITRWQADNAHIYDNIIIQPTRYGIFGGGTTVNATMSRNLIGDAGLGEWDEGVIGKLTESTGADANIYYADVADFGFNAWSDDGICSNDDFSFGDDPDPDPSSTCQAEGYQCCASCQSGSHPEYNGDCSGQVCCEVCSEPIILPPVTPVTPVPPLSPDEIAPTASANLKASGSIITPKISLKWLFSTDDRGVAGYKIFRDGFEIATTNSTYYNDTDVVYNVTYTYTVSAYDAAGNESAKSNPASAMSAPLSSIFKKGVSASTFPELVGNLFVWVLSIAGALAFLVIIFGGVMYMGSAGDDQRTVKAKRIIFWAIMGLLLILIAYSAVAILEGILN